MPLVITEGWTEPLDFTLKSNGVAIPLSTGDTISLILRDKRQDIVSTTGEVVALSSSTGAVRWTPSAADLIASRQPYYAKFKVVGPSGYVFFAPSGKPDVWDVLAGAPST